MNFAQNCQTNSTLRQDVEDLVKCRNKLFGHAQEARLTDADYSKYKSEVESIILRIARFCYIENEMQQKLNDVSQRPLDETVLIQYQNALMQQSLRDRSIEEVYFKKMFVILNVHFKIIEKMKLNLFKRFFNQV